MTVSAQPTIFQYVGNGVTTVFAYNCQVLQSSDLNVYVNGVAVTSGITKSGIGSLTGGTVTFTTAPANGAQVILEREVVLERTTDYQQNGDFLARVVNPDFNRIWMAIQQLLTSVTRSLKFPKTDVAPITELPPAASRANNLLSFDSLGNPVVVAPAAQSATALQTILALSSGSSLIGFIQAGIGAVAMTVQSMLRGIIDPRQFGAVLDGVTDDTAALQRAIQSKGAGVPVAVRLPAGVLMKISGTLYVPPVCTIDLNGCAIVGAATNTIFESGYWSGGVVVSNHAQPAETQIVYASKIYNGQVTNANKAFYLYNMCESSGVFDIRVSSCNQAVYAKRCFYGSFARILARSPLSVGAFPAFHFSDAVNAIGMDQLYAVGYTTGWLVDGVKDNFRASNCGAESCTNGIQINNSSSGIKIDGWYFEGITTAISFSAGGNHENVDIGNCFFNTTATAVAGSTIVSGIFRRTNRLNGAAVALSANFTNQLVVEIPNDTSSNNAVLALPANYALGDTTTVNYVKSIYDSGSGLVAAKARVEGGIIPFHVAGDSGPTINNIVPGCVSNLTATTLTVDTKIRFRNGAAYVAEFNISASGTQIVAGLFVADLTLSIVKPGGLTVTPSNNAGFVRITITGLVSATAFAGSVRFL